MEKYAFFLDIDGTYLDFEGKVIEENVRAVNKLVEEGHYVFICTGRPLVNVSEYIINSANWSGIISSVGADITLNGRMIKHMSVSDDYARRVAEAFLKEKRWLLMGNFEKSLACHMREDEKRWININSVEDFDKNKREISKLDMDGDMPEYLVKLVEEEMTVYYYDTYAEAGIKGVSKASAIEFLMGELGIKRECTVAIGDSGNDLEMIEYAGVGVAMANAPEYVREKADIVTDTNNNAGVAKVLSKFLNKK